MDKYFKILNGYKVKDEECRNNLENLTITENRLDNDYYQHRGERKIIFEEFGELIPQIRGIQGACTDGEFLYWCDWTSDTENSALVKSNFDGTEISRITMTTQGHPNGITYCNKDNRIYVNFSNKGIDIYNKTDLSYVKSILGRFFAANDICWYDEEEMFLFHRGTTSSYYYIDYDTLHHDSWATGHSTRDWNMVYRFNTPYNCTYVQQCDCMYNDVIYRCADRQRFNKSFQIQKFTSTGDFIEEIICEGLDIYEIESVMITENYVYVIAYNNNKIYRASINDTSNKPITYSYIHTSWSRIITQNYVRVSGYTNNNSVLPETIEEQEGNIYHLKHVPYYTGNIQKMIFIIQTQGYRAVPLTLETNFVSGGNGSDGSMSYIDYAGNVLYYVKIKGTISEAEDGNTNFTLDRLKLTSFTINTDGSVTKNSDFGAFRILAIMVEY